MAETPAKKLDYTLKSAAERRVFVEDILKSLSNILFL